MKKINIILIGIILLIIGLSGCTEKSNEKTNELNLAEKFYGTWEYVDSYDYNETWTFYENGSLKNIEIEEIEGEIITGISWLKYEVNKSHFCYSPIDKTSESPNYNYECFGYEFSSDNTSLYLTFNEIKIMEFIKI